MRPILASLILLFTVTTLSAKDFTVVIDAGHGGKDPGAISANQKIYEKNVTLNVALLVGEAIQANHPEVKVLYTRTNDTFVGLNESAMLLPEFSSFSLFAIAFMTSKKTSFAYGVLSGIVEPIGAIITILLTNTVLPILPYLLSFAAGAMIYVVVSELIPESQSNKKKEVMAIFTIIGFTIMMILDVALG